jgi:hypothetical protein
VTPSGDGVTRTVATISGSGTGAGMSSVLVRLPGTGGRPNALVARPAVMRVVRIYDSGPAVPAGSMGYASGANMGMGSGGLESGVGEGAGIWRSLTFQVGG